MLTELQEKILKRLIDNLPLSASQSVSVSDLDDLGLVCGAVRELKYLGFVLDACTLSSAEAILTDKGRNYFREKLKAQYGEATMQKIELIDRDIKEASSVLLSNDLTFIKKKIKEILDLYDEDCHGIRGKYNSFTYTSPTHEDFSGFLRILVKTLEKLKVEVFSKAEEQNRIQVQKNYNDNSVNFGDKAKVTKKAIVNTGGETNTSEQKTNNIEVNLDKKKSSWTKLLPWNWFK